MMGHGHTRGRQHDFAFAGLITCGHCGGAVTAELKKEKYVYYHCATRCQREPFVSEAKIAAIGYCFGGQLAYRAAATGKIDAAVAYYGGGIHGAKSEKPTVPTQLHFGDKDMHIPMAHVNELRQLHPGVEIFDYPADHGFHCDERGSYDKAASVKAMERTLAHFKKYVG